MHVPKLTTRREFLRLSALGAASTAILAACAPAAAPTPPPAPTAKPAEAPKAAAAPTTAPAAATAAPKPTEAPKAAAPTAAPAKPTAAPAAAAKPAGRAIEIRAHMVKKFDVSDWIETGLSKNIDGWKDKHPDITIKLETVPGWTPEYVPKILSMASAKQLGDTAWYPPRHRSHIAWGTRYNIMRDLLPLANAASYDMKQFFPGANETNTYQGKQYWMSFISGACVPITVYNKTKVKAMGLPEPTDDWTFEEQAEWAKRATKEGVFGYYRADGGNAPEAMGPFLRQWGTEPTDTTGKKAFPENMAGFVSALKYRYDVVNTWKVSPTGTGINTVELFGGQKVVAIDCWDFRAQALAVTFKDIEIGFVLTPVVKKGDKRRSMITEHTFGITNTSKEPEATFEFLTWICGKEMNVQGLVAGGKGPIARFDVWSDERVLKGTPQYGRLRAVNESVESNFNVANFRGEDFDAAFSQGYDALELGKIQPEEAAAQIQKLCQAVLDKDPA